MSEHAPLPGPAVFSFSPSAPDKNTNAGRHALPLSWFLVPAILAAAAFIVGETTDIDRVLTRLAFDTPSGTFPLRTNFWLDVVLHHWAKYAVVAIGGVLAARYALSFFLPTLKPARQRTFFMLLALSLAPLSVTVAKYASDRHCPWSVEEFGGLVPYTRLFDPLLPDIEPGRCFPAGHASTGFALMAFYFGAYAQQRRRRARIIFACAIAAGLAFGTGRVLQGAHFATHVIWSGIVCWVVMVSLYMLLIGRNTHRTQPFDTSHTD